MTATTHAVSVIIPTRADGRGLGRAVSSALQQDGVEVRLVIVVDGTPSDGGDEHLLVGLGEPHRVLHVTRLGLPGALRNLGLALVRTPYVAFLDDDDWWSPGKLNHQLVMLRGTRCALCGSNAMRMVNDEPAGLYFETMPDKLGLDDLMVTNWLITSSVMVEAEVLRSVGGFPSDEALRACDDYAGWLKVAAVGGVTTTPLPLVHYTVAAPGSISSQDDLSGSEARRLALEHLATASRYLQARLTRKQRSRLARLIAEGGS